MCAHTVDSELVVRANVPETEPRSQEAEDAEIHLPEAVHEGPHACAQKSMELFFCSRFWPDRSADVVRLGQRELISVHLLVHTCMAAVLALLLRRQ